jgi:hypothetical protein
LGRNSDSIVCCRKEHGVNDVHDTIATSHVSDNDVCAVDGHTSIGLLDRHSGTVECGDILRFSQVGREDSTREYVVREDGRNSLHVRDVNTRSRESLVGGSEDGEGACARQGVEDGLVFGHGENRDEGADGLGGDSDLDDTWERSRGGSLGGDSDLDDTWERSRGGGFSST